jgi:DNA-directed RNA polymerase specialized sigma24 family protein
VLVTRFFLGYSVAETAEVLRMPVGSVKTHAHRGMAAMRGALGESVTQDENEDAMRSA